MVFDDLYGFRCKCRQTLTSEHLVVIIALRQGANCHDLRYRTEAEILGVAHRLHVLQTLWGMPAQTTMLMFACTEERALTFCPETARPNKPL